MKDLQSDSHSCHPPHFYFLLFLRYRIHAFAGGVHFGSPSPTCTGPRFRSHGTWCFLTLSTPELIYPCRQNMVIMATVAFNQFVNPWAIEAIHWRYYIVYCGWLVFELIFVIFFVVETKRTRSLSSRLYMANFLFQAVH